MIVQSYDPAVPIGELIDHPENHRQGDVGAIHESIEANGFYGAVLVQRGTNFILAGNHRRKALAQRGAETVPVIWLDVDEQQARRILLADNKTADMADWDYSGLVRTLQDLHSEGGLAGTGFAPEELDELLAEINGGHEEKKKRTKDPAAPRIELVFDSEEQCGAFRGLVDRLREAYPVLDSTEARLIQCMLDHLGE